MFEILRTTYKDISLNEGKGRNTRTQMLNKPQILAGVSHEVRTQMNSIVAFSYLINNDRFSESERKEFSEQIITSAEQLIGLFENFFDTAVLETGASKDELQDIDAVKLFESLASKFRALMRKKGKDNIIFIQEDDLPGKLMLRMNGARTERIITNLFRNALDNTFSGFIRLGCTFSDSMITFYVKDSGQDFPRSSHLLLSDNPDIHYSDSQDTYSAMNLILARNLILASEGSVRVESNDAGGTSVFVSFPVIECSGLKIFNENNSAEKKIAI